MEVQEFHLNFIDVLLLCYGHQHVSATLVTIFRVIILRLKHNDI